MSEFGSKIFKFIGISMWVAAVCLIIANREKLTAEGIAEQLPGNMFAAAVVMVCLFALKSLSIVFSSGVLFVTSALLFPLGVALTVNMCGILVMTSLPYFIGVKGGAAELEKLCSKYPRLQALRDYNIDNMVLYSFMLRANSFINFDIGSMYLGARGVPALPYYIGSILGMLPQMIIFSFCGVSIDKGDYRLTLMLIVVQAILTLVSTVFFGKRIYEYKH